VRILPNYGSMKGVTESYNHRRTSTNLSMPYTSGMSTCLRHISVKRSLFFWGQYPVDYFSRRICVAYVFQRIDLNTSRRRKKRRTTRFRRGKRKSRVQSTKWLMPLRLIMEMRTLGRRIYWRGVGNKTRVCNKVNRACKRKISILREIYQCPSSLQNTDSATSNYNNE